MFKKSTFWPQQDIAILCLVTSDKTVASGISYCPPSNLAISSLSQGDACTGHSYCCRFSDLIAGPTIHAFLPLFFAKGATIFFLWKRTNQHFQQKGKDKVNTEKDVTLGGFGGIIIDLIDERISELNF